jgi:hypothetical protein
MTISKLRSGVVALCLAAGLSAPARAAILTFTQSYDLGLLTVSADVTDIDHDGWIRATGLGGEVTSATLSWTGPGPFTDLPATSLLFRYVLNGGPLGDDPGETFFLRVEDGGNAAQAITNRVDSNVPNHVCNGVNPCGEFQSLIQNVNLDVSAGAPLQLASVPEPASFTLVGLGLAAAAGARRRRHRAWPISAGMPATSA